MIEFSSVPAFRRRRFGCVLFVILAFGSTAGFLLAQDSVQSKKAIPPKKTWAILIGPEKYELATPLRYTNEDVRQIESTLITRGGISPDTIVTMTDKREEEEFRPKKASIMARLTEFLGKQGSEDMVIVYFSGHGFLDDNGKMYLAPLDCDPQNPAPTGIPIEWFRDQIALSKAKYKLLILDACHAGSERGGSVRGIDSEELASKFQRLERVVTIASCQSNEKSLIWDAKRQSLFSYWLNQGLRGHADDRLTGVVDFHNLYEYVDRNVKRTAEVKCGRKQTPVRQIGLGVVGVPQILKLQPMALDELLGEMADQLAYAFEEQKITKVGVFPFISCSPVTSNSPVRNESVGGQYGSLGWYCSEQLERKLLDRANGKFSVVDSRRLMAKLKTGNFQIKDLGSPRLEILSKNLGGMPVIVVGTFVQRDKNLLRMQCKLQQTEHDGDLGVTTGGTAALTLNQFASIGLSGVVDPDDRKPDPRQTPANDQNRIAAQMISGVDERSKLPGSHPFQNPNFQFRVTLTVDDQPRTGEFRGNDYFVPVTKGEKFKLVVENNSGDVALMRLLVDGLNTLPQNENEQESWGQHVSLDKARAWVLDPKDKNLKGGPPRWTIAGFAIKTGDQGIKKEFVIVDAQQSLAAQQSFTDEIGLITAVFYKPLGEARGNLGILPGNNVAANIGVRRGVTPGNQIGVVHIRYVDAKALLATRK